ncbi:MAG TPA: biotin transporter BioY [Gemmatimonadales bacterium]|nr:biotin transporter BioY [Gemmatimonadales bacterium]
MTNPFVSAPGAEARRRSLRSLGRRVALAVAGAVVVAAAAQVAVPLTFTRVPLTLQPLAVLVVGGILGASGGLAALVTYLAMGMSGLPVFAEGFGGAVHLVGPTGGYLLAYPVAAFATGRIAREGAGIGRLLAACAAGMLIIHVGGFAQLSILTGDPANALRLGFYPFVTNDLLKIGLAALVLMAARPGTRSLR